MKMCVKLFKLIFVSSFFLLCSTKVFCGSHSLAETTRIFENAERLRTTRLYQDALLAYNAIYMHQEDHSEWLANASNRAELFYNLGVVLVQTHNYHRAMDIWHIIYRNPEEYREWLDKGNNRELFNSDYNATLRGIGLGLGRVEEHHSDNPSGRRERPVEEVRPVLGTPATFQNVEDRNNNPDSIVDSVGIGACSIQ